MVRSSSFAGKMTSSTSPTFLTFFHHTALVRPGGRLDTTSVRIALGSDGPADADGSESSVMWVADGSAGRGFLIFAGAGSVDSGSIAAG